MSINKNYVVLILVVNLFINFGIVKGQEPAPQPVMPTQTVQDIADIFLNTKDIGNNNKSTETLLKKILGNDNVVNMDYENEFHLLSYSGWDNMILTDLERLFKDELLYKEDYYNKDNVWNDDYTEMSEEISGYLTTSTMELRPEKLQSFNDRQEGYEILNENLNNRKEKINNIIENNMYKYSSLLEDEKGTFNDFIKTQEEKVENTNNEFDDNLNKTNLTTAIQSLNKLVLQQNQILLKNSTALKDMNEQLTVLLSIISQNDMEEEYKRIESKYKGR